jgi:hypothetical protein
VIEVGLRTLLITDAQIAAILGTRVYPLILPQGPTLPAATYFKVSGEDQISNSGSQDYGWARYQIDAWATTFTAAQTLADLIRSRLHGFNGAVTSGSDSWSFQGIFAMTVRDFYESDPKQYRVSRDFMVWFDN